MLAILLSNELSVTGLTVRVTGNRMATIGCTADDVVSMQWSIAYSDIDILIDWNTIDESTEEEIVIVEGLVMSSMYLTPSTQPPYSIESVITISPTFSGVGIITFICSGDRVSGTFTSSGSVSFQGSAPTTSQFINTPAQHAIYA